MKKLLLLFLLFVTTSSFACSCNDISFEKAVDWADEIFFGRLVEIEEVEFEINEQHPEEKYTRVWYALFEIEKKWKGSSRKFVKVYQPATSCDAMFNNLGNYHLIYAKRENMFSFWPEDISNIKLTTWLCSRSREYQGVNEPNDDLKLLDKKYPNPVKLSSFNLKCKPIFYGFSIFFIGLLLGFIIKKKSKKPVL